MRAFFLRFKRTPPYLGQVWSTTKTFQNDFLLLRLKRKRLFKFVLSLLGWNSAPCIWFRRVTVNESVVKAYPKKICSKREMSKAIYQFTNMCLNFSMHSELDICPPPFTPQADEFKANDNKIIVLRWLFLQRKDQYKNRRGGEFGNIKWEIENLILYLIKSKELI